MLSLLLLSAALLSPAARAWDSVGATWPAETFPIPWWLDQDAVLDGASDEELEAAVQAGFQTWTQVACAPGVSFSYQGRKDGASFGAQDGANVVFLLEEAWPEDAGLLTAPTIFTAGSELVEVDIALNLQHYAWELEGADGTSSFDVQAGVVHEVGHLLGLWHSTVTGASLNPAMDGNPEARSLEADDQDGLCALYGDLAAAGSGEVGEACVTTEDCLAGLTCLVDGAERYCTQACEGDADCPADMACAALSTGEQVCAWGEEETGCGCAAGGEPAAARGAVLGLLGALLVGWRRRRA